MKSTSEDERTMSTAEPEEQRAKAWAGRTALVVDDSMLIRHTVCRHLEALGFVLETATNGVEALAMLGNLRPDVIITDLLMPEMGGRELITKLKGNPELASTPIVVVAAKIKANYEPEESRADYIIYKDIEIEQQLDLAMAKVLGES
jgi:CheY-like chemotaxis protein